MCVIRSTSFYNRYSRGSKKFPAVALMEACAHELLRVLRVPVAVRPHDKSKPLNLTFFSNMNFMVSRERLQFYRYAAWSLLADRFVNVNLCLPWTKLNSTSNDTMPSSTNVSVAGAIVEDDDETGQVVDLYRVAKFTLGMTTEFLQQTIFGFSPLEDGPTPAVPLDKNHCLNPAPSECHFG